MPLLTADPNNQDFILAVKALMKNGDFTKGATLEVDGGILEVEYTIAETTEKYEAKMNFPFHQHIFNPCVILKKQDSNVRIPVYTEQLN